MKPFMEREFIKECMSVAREFIQKRKVFLKKLFSQQEQCDTMKRRIGRGRSRDIARLSKQFSRLFCGAG